MEPVTTVLGGVVIAIMAGAIGKSVGANGKISEGHCEEKRKSCQSLLGEKIDNVGKKVDALAKVVSDKILSL